MTAYRQAKLRVKEVANPSYMPAHDGERWNPRKVAAMVNIRESAVASLAARGQLDDCQVKVADVFRGHWEAMGGVGAEPGKIKSAREMGAFSDSSSRTAHSTGTTPDAL